MLCSHERTYFLALCTVSRSDVTTFNLLAMLALESLRVRQNCKFGAILQIDAMSALVERAEQGKGLCNMLCVQITCVQIRYDHIHFEAQNGSGQSGSV